MNIKNITKQEVLNAQKAWGEGIVKIGQIFLSNGDYIKAAKNHINTLYGYDLGCNILFKPTLAAEKQFRPTFDDALSYFIGKAAEQPHHEDSGFAIKPWTNVRWENPQIITDKGEIAVAMGNYYFTHDGAETKAEYTFAYIKDDQGNLKIILHHSSLPYSQ